MHGYWAQHYPHGLLCGWRGECINKRRLKYRPRVTTHGALEKAALSTTTGRFDSAPAISTVPGITPACAQVKHPRSGGQPQAGQGPGRSLRARARAPAAKACLCARGTRGAWHCAFLFNVGRSTPVSPRRPLPAAPCSPLPPPPPPPPFSSKLRSKLLPPASPNPSERALAPPAPPPLTPLLPPPPPRPLRLPARRPRPRRPPGFRRCPSPASSLTTALVVRLSRRLAPPAPNWSGKPPAPSCRPGCGCCRESLLPSWQSLPLKPPKPPTFPAVAAAGPLLVLAPVSTGEPSPCQRAVSAASGLQRKCMPKCTQCDLSLEMVRTKLDSHSRSSAERLCVLL